MERTAPGTPYWITPPQAAQLEASLPDGALRQWVARHHRKWLSDAESRTTIALTDEELAVVTAAGVTLTRGNHA